MAEQWGAEWEPSIGGGRIRLPVVAGLRRGIVEGRLSIAAEGSGSRIRFEQEREELFVHRSAVMVLLIGAIGGILCSLWPFFPALLAIAPVGLVLAFMSWLMITSRLRMSGPADFLEDLAADERPDPSSFPTSQ